MMKASGGTGKYVADDAAGRAASAEPEPFINQAPTMGKGMPQYLKAAEDATKVREASVCPERYTPRQDALLPRNVGRLLPPRRRRRRRRPAAASARLTKRRSACAGDAPVWLGLAHLGQAPVPRHRAQGARVPEARHAEAPEHV